MKVGNRSRRYQASRMLHRAQTYLLVTLFGRWYVVDGYHELVASRESFVSEIKREMGERKGRGR